MSSVHYFLAPCVRRPAGKRVGVLRRLRRWLLGQPAPDVGRRRIDPAMSWGHWAAGWSEPVKPTKR